ncbi:flagellar protein flis [Heliomicrobium modesticaldum Ice1]|uniref:Flagellar protein flis n=1 Tax=Heliobacterium modesticaldum (strain ATCC 51547 / Ice1) TaxID=498761 RepID=B0TH00_HELMI|nr:flagellar export chaperone FliS [Heliomicrobium modesticaldum]ABZ83325.1 flagellar protein flis [Heliomicrobium modesticaldum Ice1]
MDRIPTEQEIFQMSSQEITLLLYQNLTERLQLSIAAIREKKFNEANIQLQKANAIVERLGAGINYEAGAMAEQLDALYNYVADRLYEANWKKDISIIEELLRILTPVAEAWEQMLKEKPTTRAEQIRLQTSAYERNLAYDDAETIHNGFINRRE